MKDIKELGEIVSTDILVIGGGIAGLPAAIKARESQADVLVVDKGGIGWVGQVPPSGGDVFFLPQERVEEFFKWTVQDGAYLNNQDWTYAFAQDIGKDIMELNEWGFPFVKIKGEVAILSLQRDWNTVRFVARRGMMNLKKAALVRGVKTLDKVFMVDLLKKDGKVVGAIGFGLADGKTYIFNATAVIIANGSCRYKQKWFSVNTGEGVAMAYRAGAELMNAEFSNTYAFGPKATGLHWRRTPAYLFFENALGESIMEKHYPEAMAGRVPGQEKQDFLQIADAMAKEVEAGRGPIYLDMSKLTPEERTYIDVGRSIAPGVETIPERLFCKDLKRVLLEKCDIDPDKDKVEMQPMFVGGQGPIRIDTECQTTVEGLWAIGDAPSLGSGWTGARSSGTHPGAGIGFAIVSGFRGGRSAGEYAMTSSKVKIDYNEAERVKRRVFAALSRGGTMECHGVVRQIHEAVVPIRYNLHREGTRLKEALRMVDKAKKNLPKISVTDYHELARYHQAESMAMNAEWTLKAALMRNESRGTHHREDYPNRDDANWLKWIVIKEKDGVARFSTETVPLEKYRLKP